MKRILVAGGAGYIGSHTVVSLIENGYNPVIMDNLCNSSRKVIERIMEITGRNVPFYEADARDEKALCDIFADEKPDGVIMFAGLKSVGESVAKPLEYFDNNFGSLISVCRCMKNAGCRNLIFSSSATVYGNPDSNPICEDFLKKSPQNPYGRTKSVIEDMLCDLRASDDFWNIGILRYFNPIGAHPSGLIGEDPKGIPNNLVPYIAQVAVGRREYLRVYGDDYDTPDGTGIRDYIHVTDLADGHVAMLKKMEKGLSENPLIVNLGTGSGYSVLQVLHIYEKAAGIEIPYKIEKRRPGDIAACWCNPKKAEDELCWKAQKDLLEMCRDSINFQRKNPNGYETAF